MVFSSPLFIFLFLPAVLAVYFFARWRLQNFVLLVASLVFYGWGELKFLSLLLGSVALNYVFGILLGTAEDPRIRKWSVAFAVTVNLVLLAYYKYATFAFTALDGLLRALHLRRAPAAIASIALPLGISFFTFHAISYLVDIYRKKVVPQRNFFKLALYILFFPQLVAGPIVRYHEIARQFNGRYVTAEQFAVGARRFILGLGKKVLIANTLAVPADAIFALPAAQLTTHLSWVGALAYSLQIYFDFSGYSDMAIGLARLFGFTFPENFDYPYISQSMTEFWRRWHMSLSRWFRDYLYVPMGGNRVSTTRLYFNLTTVFFLCGLWHGAGWCFVVWGLLHGGFLVLERGPLGPLLQRSPRVLRHLYAGVVIVASWVVFRAATLKQVGSFYRAMAGFGASATQSGPPVELNREELLALVVGLVGCTPVLAGLSPHRAEAAQRGVFSSMMAYALTFSIFFAAVVRLSAGTYNPFIYFRF